MYQSIIIINVLSALLLVGISLVNHSNGASSINKHLNKVIGKTFNFPDYDSSSPQTSSGSLMRSGNDDHEEYEDYYYDNANDHNSNNENTASTTISNLMIMKVNSPPSSSSSSATSNRNCHCVPIGTCKSSVPLILQLNLRIMTQPSPSSMGSTTPNPSSIPHCLTNTEICCDQSSSSNIGNNNCGIRNSPNGNNLNGTMANEAPYGAYPWQAILLENHKDYIGSGVLISNSHVLTVAHKFMGINNSSVTVRLGEWNMENESEQFPVEDFPVLYYIIHPEFEMATLKNDIAIIKLMHNVTIGHVPTIGTICLGNMTFFGLRCWVSGWGQDSHNEDHHHHMHHRIQKHIDIPILENVTCQQQLSATRLGQSFRFDTNSFLCAGGENGKDACAGDGGAPLVCLHQSSNKWYLAGLVAWGIGCGQLNVPGVYINIHNFIPWIQQNMN